MASNNRRVIFNTRERLLSNDLNDMTALLHAKSTDELAAALSGDTYGTASAMSGVMGGGEVEADGVSLVVRVSPMLAFKKGTPATGLDSPYQKIQSLSTVQIDLTPYVDPANPRWVAIEVAAGDAAELVSARDIFQPALGTFTVANVDKIRQPSPTFSVNAGAAAPAPALPAGVTGVLPLAYVYIPAAAAAIATTDVVRCRPLLNPSLTVPSDIRGGGVDVTATGTTVVTMRGMSYRRQYTGFALTAVPGVTVDAALAGDVNWKSGESYPAGEVPIYAYAMAAPYPAGYDTDILINREFFDVSGRIPSNPFPAMINGLVFFSTTAPPTTGPVGNFGGTVGLNDATWAGGTTSTTVYIGAVSKQNIAPAGFCTQRTRGDQVRFTEQGKLGQDFSTKNASAATNVTSTLRNRGPLGLGAILALADCYPQAYRWDTIVDLNNQAGPLAVTAEITGSDEPVSSAKAYHYSSGAAPDQARQRMQWEFRTDLTGQITWTHSEVGGGGNTVLRLETIGYHDPVLEHR